MGPRRNCQKNQSAFTGLYFLTRNSQNFEKEHIITVVDKTLVSNIPKIQAIPWQNKEVIIFQNNVHNEKEQPGMNQMLCGVAGVSR